MSKLLECSTSLGTGFAVPGQLLEMVRPPMKFRCLGDFWWRAASLAWLAGFDFVQSAGDSSSESNGFLQSYVGLQVTEQFLARPGGIQLAVDSTLAVATRYNLSHVYISTEVPSDCANVISQIRRAGLTIVGSGWGDRENDALYDFQTLPFSDIERVDLGALSRAAALVVQLGTDIGRAALHLCSARTGALAPFVSLDGSLCMHAKLSDAHAACHNPFSS